MKGLVNCSLFNQTHWPGAGWSDTSGNMCYYDARIDPGDTHGDSVVTFYNAMHLLNSSGISPYQSPYVRDPSKCADLRFGFNVSNCELKGASFAGFYGDFQWTAGLHAEDFDDLVSVSGSLRDCEGSDCKRGDELTLLIDPKNARGGFTQTLGYSYRQPSEQDSPFSCGLFDTSQWSGFASIMECQADAPNEEADCGHRVCTYDATLVNGTSGDQILLLYNPVDILCSQQAFNISFGVNSCARAEKDGGSSYLYGTLAGQDPSRQQRGDINAFHVDLTQCTGEQGPRSDYYLDPEGWGCDGLSTDSWILTLAGGDANVNESTAAQYRRLVATLYEGEVPSDYLLDPVSILIFSVAAAFGVLAGIAVYLIQNPAVRRSCQRERSRRESFASGGPQVKTALQLRLLEQARANSEQTGQPQVGEEMRLICPITQEEFALDDDLVADLEGNVFTKKALLQWLNLKASESKPLISPISRQGLTINDVEAPNEVQLAAVKRLRDKLERRFQETASCQV